MNGPSEQARALTEHVFAQARAQDFCRAVFRVEQVLEEVRTQAYEAGRAAARREGRAA